MRYRRPLNLKIFFELRALKLSHNPIPEVGPGWSLFGMILPQLEQANLHSTINFQLPIPLQPTKWLAVRESRNTNVLRIRGTRR